MKQGLASVIIPTHNRSDLLMETLDSAFANDHAVEVIVVDDASSDDTQEIMRQRTLGDPSLVYLRSDAPIGACRARNLGLERAQGEYVMFLDSDDLIHPEKISRQAHRLNADPNLDAIVAQMAHFNTIPGDCDLLWNTFAGDPPVLRFLQHDPVWGMHAPLWRTEVVRQIGGLDESLPMAQDYEFHTRALLLGVRFHLVSELTTYCRRHAGPSISEDRQLKRIATLLKVLRSLEQVRSVSEAERHAIEGTLLWLADVASTQRESRLAREALSRVKNMPRGFALMAWANRLTGRHRFHVWARNAAVAAGHDLAVREDWYFRRRIQDEPNLDVPNVQR